MVECARLESVYTFTRIGGSNPPLSAILITLLTAKGQLIKDKRSRLGLMRGSLRNQVKLINFQITRKDANFEALFTV